LTSRTLAALAVIALLPGASPGAAKKPPAQPLAPVPDERLYQNAMECKVRLEALAMAARKESERKRIDQALALWVAQEQAIGSKLGKTEGDILADEIFFGLEEGARPASLQHAVICLQHAAAASWAR
jgi:hypothetical protein